MNKTLSVILAIFLTAVIVFGLTFGVMYLQNRALKNELSAYQSNAGSYTKLNEVRSLIDKVFIGEVDEDYMTEQLCGAMVQGIDDEWSYYITADEYSAYLENVTNSYVGIGITIRQMAEDDPGFTIVEVAPNSPAEAAGLKAGDVLISAEGQNAIEIGMDATKNLVRGEEGTTVNVVFRIDGEDRELQIARATVKAINVTYEMLENNIGYILIRNFEQNCATDTINAIEDLRAKGAVGLVFDLRFNPGGLKNELVELLDYLLPEGVIFHSETYTGKEEYDRSDANYLDMPMSVLVNVDSYSAAEFFAAAMQEYDAATVVGTQTYGKGYFQQCFRLSDGSAVNISTGKYYTPDGDSLAGVGITPDIVVEISDEDYVSIYYHTMEHENDTQLQQAVAALGVN